MTVDHFTVDQFDSIIKSIRASSCHSGIIMGERIWYVPLDAQTQITVRSSIHVSGTSASSGDDSIRLWLSELNDGHARLGKVDTYTTRVAGWEHRLRVKIEYLASLRNLAGDCARCENPLHIFLVAKDGPNKGRPFATCKNCSDEKNNFFWLDKPRVAFFKKLPVGGYAMTDIVNHKNPTLPVDTIESSSTIDFLSLLPPVEESPSSTMDDLLSMLPDEDEYEPVRVQIEPQSPRSPTDEQLAVITSPIGVPARVMAGAGSGKTFSMARRYEYLVNNGASANSILVVTFNKKMASEISNRIVSLVPSVLNSDAGKQICTIHAFCKRALSEFYPHWKKYAPCPTQQNPTWIIKKFIEESLAKFEPNQDNRPLWTETFDWIEMAKGQGYTFIYDTEFFYPALGAKYGELLDNVRKEFDAKMRGYKDGLVTFSDMLLDMELALANDPAFLRYWKARIEHIILDEAQDTTEQAMRILCALTQSITMVGDHDQLLYRFAGAAPEYNLLDGFESRYPSGLTFFLTRNYRSTQSIVSAGLKSIQNNYQDFDGLYEMKYLKQSRAADNAAMGKPIEYYEYANLSEEGAEAVAHIQRIMQEENESPGSFFVGFRTRSQSAYLEQSLIKASIPFINTTGKSFWTLPHVQDVVDYFRLGVNPMDKGAISRVYNIASNQMKNSWKSHADYGKYCSHRFLGKEFMELVGDGGMKKVRNLTIRNRPDYAWKFAAAGKDFADLVDGIANEIEQCEDDTQDGMTPVIEFIVNNCYKKHMAFEDGTGDDGEGSKMDDLAAVADMAGNYESGREFVVFVDKMLSLAKMQESDDWSGKVVLSTIHRLKGQERPWVIGVGISEGDRTVNKNPVAGLLPHTYSMTTPTNDGKLPGKGQGLIEDERCLFYVLITRAMRGVVLTGIRKYRHVWMKPSRFVEELGLVKYAEE